MVDYFWEHLGGSVWEIRQAFVHYKNTGKYIPHIQLLIQDEYAKIFDYWFKLNGSRPDDKKRFDRVCTILAHEGLYIAKVDEYLSDLIKEFVDKDIRFYDARTQTITANSQSVRKAFQKMYL
jgi:hypothetical protein